MKIVEITKTESLLVGKALELDYIKEALFDAEIEATQSGLGYVLDWIAQDVISVVKHPNQNVRFFTDKYILTKAKL